MMSVLFQKKPRKMNKWIPLSTLSVALVGGAVGYLLWKKKDNETWKLQIGETM
jgi:hypothetical protein